MDMGGVTSLYPPGEAAVRAVEAGADVLLMPPVPDAAMAGLEDAVESGRISDQRSRRIRATHSRRPRRGSASTRIGSSIFARLEREIRACRNTKRRPRASPTAASRCCAIRRNSCRSTPRGRCASCSSRFPPIPIRIPAKQSSRKFAARVDSLTVLRADTQFSTVSTLKLPPPGDLRRGHCGAFRARGRPQGQRRLPRRSARLRESIARARASRSWSRPSAARI